MTIIIEIPPQSISPISYRRTGQASQIFGRLGNRGGVYWEIPMGDSPLSGRKKVVVIQKIKCPNQKCGRRVCAIGVTRFRIIIELRCPHCGEIVRVS